MKISRWEFEKELDGFINAALSASSKETARQYLNKADGKIDGYDNIPDDLKRLYKQKVREAQMKLDI